VVSAACPVEILITPRDRLERRHPEWGGEQPREERAAGRCGKVMPPQPADVEEYGRSVGKRHGMRQRHVRAPVHLEDCRAASGSRRDLTGTFPPEVADHEGVELEGGAEQGEKENRSR